MFPFKSHAGSVDDNFSDFLNSPESSFQSGFYTTGNLGELTCFSSDSYIKKVISNYPSRLEITSSFAFHTRTLSVSYSLKTEIFLTPTLSRVTVHISFG